MNLCRHNIFTIHKLMSRDGCSRANLVSDNQKLKNRLYSRYPIAFPNHFDSSQPPSQSTQYTRSRSDRPTVHPIPSPRAKVPITLVSSYSQPRHHLYPEMWELLN